MKKLLKFILWMGVIGVLSFVGAGYYEYQRALYNHPLEEVVREYTEKKDYVEYEDLTETFVQAVVSIEDRRYFNRNGFDFIAFFRALRNNFQEGRIVEGGSTIPQQIAKNLYFYEDTSLVRKFSEVWMMYKLEAEYSKEELLALYVNMNYYGDGYWGIKQACKGYFHAHTDCLTLAQSALLAGIPQAPGVYQLSTGYELAKKRQEIILDAMVENGYISEQEAMDAKEEVLL